MSDEPDFKTSPNKKADLRRLFYWVLLNYFAAGAATAEAASAAGADAAGAAAAGAAAGASTTGAGAGLLQAVRVKANRAAIRAERNILNPLGEIAQNCRLINSS